MSMSSNNPSNCSVPFNKLFDTHVKHLQYLRSKMIDTYSRAIRRLGDVFNYEVEDLTEDQLLDHFSALIAKSFNKYSEAGFVWSQIFYLHVLKRPWTNIPLIKSPWVKRLPNVLMIDEVCLMLSRTRI